MSPRFWKVGFPIALAISLGLWYGIIRGIINIWPFDATSV